MNKELQSVIPVLNDSEKRLFENNKLGFEGWSSGDEKLCQLIPTDMSPSYWIWVCIDCILMIEEYSTRPVVCTRMPWSFLKQFKFEAKKMEPIFEYPPKLEPKSESEKIKEARALYIIRMGGAGPIKIGIATDPYSRMNELQTGNPQELQLIKVYDYCAMFEDKIHKELENYRMQGEWFANQALPVAVNIMNKYEGQNHE